MTTTPSGSGGLLEQAETLLVEAKARLEPLDLALAEAHALQLRHYLEDRERVVDAIAARDPVRIEVMDLEDIVADLRAMAGGPPTIGRKRENRGI